jgi:hypothetical protein
MWLEATTPNHPGRWRVGAGIRKWNFKFDIALVLSTLVTPTCATSLLGGYVEFSSHRKCCCWLLLHKSRCACYPFSGVGSVQGGCKLWILIVSCVGVYHWAPLICRRASCQWHHQILCRFFHSSNIPLWAPLHDVGCWCVESTDVLWKVVSPRKIVIFGELGLASLRLPLVVPTLLAWPSDGGCQRSGIAIRGGVDGQWLLVHRTEYAVSMVAPIYQQISGHL